MTTFDDPVSGTPQWEQDERGIWRDRWTRPGIIPPRPEGDDRPRKRKGYARATTIAKTPDDTDALTKWKARGTLVGAALRPDLVKLAEGLDLKDDKIELNELVKTLHDEAGMNNRREHGTDLHTLMEALDDGSMTREDFNALPEADQADVRAYWRVTKASGLVHAPGHREVFLVDDEREIAGTADGLATIRPNSPLSVHRCGLHHIDDLKTGNDEYGALSWSIQLAIYAESELYDITTDRRIETPEICQRVGFIIALPQGTGKAKVYGLDLARGRAGRDLALKVRAARRWGKRKEAMRLMFDDPEGME